MMLIRTRLSFVVVVRITSAYRTLVVVVKSQSDTEKVTFRVRGLFGSIALKINST